MSTPTAAPKPTANSECWSESQAYELNFWKNLWPYRHLALPALQELRQKDAGWLLTNLGFVETSPRRFEGFSGSVLEVGCGPLGFFEITEDVECTAIDSLMEAYAREISYSTLGRRGRSTYVTAGLAEIGDQFQFVVCSNVLDHTADWLEFLEMLRDRVASDGELLLLTDARGVPMQGHTQVFTPSQLSRAARWLGLTNVKHFRANKSDDGHCDWTVFLRAGS